MSQFSLNQLTKGIRDRHVGNRTRVLVEKWKRTGLLRSLEGTSRENMAVLFENQAAQLLREQNSVGTGGSSPSASGDLEGFTNIAFPIVRRVFGGLVANELVSIQPMSLPAGLLFYLDYTYGTNVGGKTGGAATYSTGSSIYGNPAGAGVRSGSLAAGGQYDLAGSGYSKVHTAAAEADYIYTTNGVDMRGSFKGSSTFSAGSQLQATGTDGRMIQFDPQLTTLIEDAAASNSGELAGSTGMFQMIGIDLSNSAFSGIDLTMIKDIAVFGNESSNGMAAFGSKFQDGTGIINLRRLNELGTWNGATFTAGPLSTTNTSNVVCKCIVSGALTSDAAFQVSFIKSPSYTSNNGQTLVIPTFESNFATTPSPAIPEIDIKVESVPVTAATRKLRARWSPELAQDLNAYHSLDAEVELTQILSEQIALELDREILNDLLTQANGANLYWSRAPGKFVNKENGALVNRGTSLSPGPAFMGTTTEWYQTLAETIIDCANTIHRKTLRGSANFIVVGPDVATIIECSIAYRPAYSIDKDGQVGSSFTMGAEKIGSLSNRFTVYKDPYFPRNKILVGYKGGSYLETGYVYAPYVPLIVTPTIFAPEDFTPRKGVMTRYGKKMVRSDFYGTVTCMDMNVI